MKGSLKKEEMIAVARGEKKGDLLLKNGRIVDLFTGEIYKSDILIFQGKIVGIGNYSLAQKVIDLKKSYLLPGLIESHIHIESSLLSPNEFSALTLPSGTTSLFCDPHEIANVLGIKGIYYFLKATKDLPQDFYFLIPSCVPATDFETAGGKIGLYEIRRLLKEDRVFGLAEVMNFPGVVKGERPVLAKILLVEGRGVIDGHAPNLTGKELCAYRVAGILSDHESSSLAEAKEKLRMGVWIMIREGSAAKNLKDLAPLINWRTQSQILLCSDDKHPKELLNEGHLNAILKRGVSLGIDPLLLIRMVTINPARYFGLKEVGAIAPGYRADLVVTRDLKRFDVIMVIKDGRLVVRDGEPTLEAKNSFFPHPIHSVSSPFQVKDFSQTKLAVREEGRVIKVIGLIPDQIITKKILALPKVRGGYLLSDPERDILKIVVVERHRGTGNLGVGFVKGFGLKDGAVASSIAHDSHNIIAVGVKDEDIFYVVKRIIEMRGGMVAFGRGKEATLPLPIAGLMSNQPAKEVIRKLEELNRLAKELGSTLKNLFATLSFLTLPVIPELKLTDRGLFDVTKFKFVSLFGEER